MIINEHLRKPRILITEDDQENQKFLEMFLRRKFDVDLCDSAQTFFECLSKVKYDVILMDISLRGNKNGLELTQELRKLPEHADTPVVCLSAHAFKRDRDNALNAGVDVFLTKPVENQLLVNTLLEVITKKAAKN